MQFRILLFVLPIFIIKSIILIFFFIVYLKSTFLGIIFCIISIFVIFILVETAFYNPQSQFNNISKSSVDIQKLDVIFNDGIKSTGKIYRSNSKTILTSNGRRYSEPKPTIIFFHGFWSKKEINEFYLIPLAHMGYISIAFDQRGHGEAEGRKGDWFKMFNDVEEILDLICALEDVRLGSICCIGKSMGGTSVLTKCYQDKRVAMVVGISALHHVDLLLNSKFRFLSAGWFVRKQISKVKDRRALKISAHYFLKKDSIFNQNRVYLIHGSEDKIFPPSITFELNKKQARIQRDHSILLDNCGHNLVGQESLVFGILIKWIHNNKAMKLN